MKNPSVKRILIASLLAVILSLMQPMLLAFSAAVCLTPVLIAVLYAWAGWIPALLLSVGSIGAVETVGGALSGSVGYAALAAAVALVLPGLAAAWMLNKRLPFFRRMLMAAVVQIGALAAVICVAYLGFQVDLVDFIFSNLRGKMDAVPDSVLQVVLQNFYMQGMLTEESVKMATTGIVTRGDIKKVLDQAFEAQSYHIRLNLPALLINSGLVTGIFMTTLPSLICARRGDEPPVKYYPVSEWFLPSRAVVGLAVCMLTGYALQLASVSGAEAVSLTFGAIGRMLFIVQGVAALSRRFKENGMRRGGRIAMIVAGLLLATHFIMLVGAASALLGRKGAISGWMRRKMEEKRKEDDDE